jgi:hypothetical protein
VFIKSLAWEIKCRFRLEIKIWNLKFEIWKISKNRPDLPSPWSILGFQNFCAISKICALWNIPLSFLYREYWGLIQCFLLLYAFHCATNECLFSSSPSVMPASWSPGPRTPLPKMCLPVWAVPHVAGTLKSVQASVYSAYSLPFHHKSWMKIFYLVIFKPFIIFFCMWPYYAPFFDFISVRDLKCHISVNSQPIDLEFNLGAYIYIKNLSWDQGDICNNWSSCIAEYITCGFKLTYGPAVQLLPLAMVSSKLHHKFRAPINHSTGGACTVLRYFCTPPCAIAIWWCKSVKSGGSKLES